MTNDNETLVLTTSKFDGSDEAFWTAVAIYNDPDSEETESIAAAVLLQQVLMLAQDALTRPSDNAPAASVPAKIIAKPKPGEIVAVERAVELFGDSWVLRPAGPVSDSALSPVRDYRVHEGKLQYNAGYPVEWKDSASTIDECPQWLVIARQSESMPPSEAPNGARASRTSLRAG